MSHATPWVEGKHLTTADVQAILQQNFPELTIKSISALGDGWDNTTWLINEIKTLPHLPALNASHPKPKFVCMEPHGFDYPIYAHPYLKGISADRAKLSMTDRTALASQLGFFLKALHSFPLEKAKQLDVGFDQIERANFKKRYALTESRLEYLFAKRLVKNPKALLSAFKQRLDTKVPDLVVLGHGDLYARHILLDDTKSLTAVIDWGDCELLSPAVDLRIVYQFLPLTAHSLFWRAYGEVALVIKEAAILCATYSSVTIAWYAHQIQDEALLVEGLLGLELIKEAFDKNNYVNDKA